MQIIFSLLLCYYLVTVTCICYIELLFIICTLIIYTYLDKYRIYLFTHVHSTILYSTVCSLEVVILCYEHL